MDALYMYHAPALLGLSYNIGVMAAAVLGVQVTSGVLLVLMYEASGDTYGTLDRTTIY